MQKVNVVKAVSLLSVALFLGGVATVDNASAKAVKTTNFRVTKITKNTHYKKSTFTKKAPKKGIALYSSRYLTKHVTTKKTHVFYSTQSVRVKKSTGKSATYRYVTNKKGTVKGWIWTGRLTGKQGKTTSVSNQTVIAPTTNVKIAKKTTTKKLTGSANKSKDDVYLITDAVSNKNFRGAKNVAVFRDKINQLGMLIAKHPHAWDNTLNYEIAYAAYSQAWGVYVNQIKTGVIDGKDTAGAIKPLLNAVNMSINKAEY